MSNQTSNQKDAGKDAGKAAAGKPGAAAPAAAKTKKTYEGQFKAIGRPMTFSFGMSSPRDNSAPKMIVSITCEIEAGRCKGEVLQYTGVFNKDPGKEDQYRRTVESCKACGIESPKNTSQFGKDTVLLTCSPNSQNGELQIQFINAQGLRNPMSDTQLDTLANEWGAYGGSSSGGASSGAQDGPVLDENGNPIDF